jgi:hypothetical protein
LGNGRTLIAKVAVFAAVLAIGGYNRYWLVPNVSDATARDGLLRNVGVEWVILLFAVLGLASLLANTPPAHGPCGHAGHSMMAMFIGEPRRTLSDETGFDRHEVSQDLQQMISNHKFLSQTVSYLPC